jgi:flagellar hook-associated protein 3 FlgL
MRISTSMIHTLASGGIGRNSSEVVKLQQQLASGKRIMSPADDPLGAAKVVQYAHLKGQNTQIGVNQIAAGARLRVSEVMVGDAGDVLQDVRQVLIEAGDGSFSASDRRTVVQKLRGLQDRLFDIANGRDEKGAYLFSGTREETQPFTRTPGGVTYSGDQGRQEIQVAPGRTIVTSENGAELFQRIRTGNGAFTATPAATNAGTALIDRGSVVTPALVTNQNYTVTFNVVGTVTTYDVFNVTTATAVSTGNAYTTGQSIQFDGIQFTSNGAPANGDTVSIAPSPNKSVFDTIADAIAAIEPGAASTAADQTRYTNSLGRAMNNIDLALDQVLTVRATMGAALLDLEAAMDATQSRDADIQRDLSQVRDLDYAKAISDYARAQQALEAAQRSYAQIGRQTLFDFL